MPNAGIRARGGLSLYDEATEIRGNHMAANIEDHITIMNMTGRGVSNARTDIDVRGMAFTIDEPPERGGHDDGPTPPETLLAALV